MAKNIRQNQVLITCPACNVKHSLAREGLAGTTFDCEGCNNEIHVESETEVYVVAIPENAKVEESYDDSGIQGSETIIRDSKQSPADDARYSNPKNAFGFED